MINVAVLGLGWWGPKILRNLRQHPLVEKAIGVDVSREVCRRVANEVGCETSCEPAEILADPEIDGIVIATPPATHHPIAVAAFEAGKHVLVTKPPTNTIEELEDLVRRAEIGDRVFMMDSTFVYSEPVRKLKDLLDGGIMPDIRFVQSLRYGNDLRFHHVSRLRNTMLKNGIDVVNDLIFHDLAILTYLFPDNRLLPIAVHESFSLSDDLCDTAFVRLDATRADIADRARGGSTTGIESGTAANAVDAALEGQCECMSFPIHIGLSWTLPERRRELLISDRGRQIIYNDLKDINKISIFDVETQREKSIEHGQAEPLFLVVDHFLQCIQNRTRPLTDGHYMLYLTKTFMAVQALMQKNQRH